MPKILTLSTRLLPDAAYFASVFLLSLVKFPLLRFFLLFAPLAFTVFISANESRLHVARMFGDNMVLQQLQLIPVWGESEPGTAVRVSLAGVFAETKADTGGRWMAKLPALPSGGPFELAVVAGTETASFRNVMIGEVWLSSGQSNMDFRLKNATGGWDDSAKADLPNIRYLRVEQIVSSQPRADLTQATWEVCSLSTAPEFSAVAFYFARELQLKRGVAVGIINATWSGTPAEAWTSARMLELHADFRDRMKAIAQKNESWEEGQKETDGIEQQREAIAEKGTAGLDHGVHRLAFDDRHWRTANYPLDAVTMQLPEYSLVWARKTVELPPAAAGRDLTLQLGNAYEWDQTYFNGEKIGSMRWEGLRTYTVPGRLVKAGRNVIAVRLLSEWFTGQLGKKLDDPVLESADHTVKVSLTGPWKFDLGFEPVLPVGHYYKNDPSALFNGMIAPLVPYAIRGALWYQGEGNAGNPMQYRTLLPALILDWRARWGQGHFPFLVVQLPNIDASIGRPWPELREAQAMAVRQPNVGLAVTIDVGDPYNIHPANKRFVGERLYRVASHVAYKETGVWTGPIFADFTIEQKTIRVKFTETGSGLMTSDGGAVKGFEIKAHSGDYEPAEARIDGDTVIVSSPRVTKPVAVRYAWAANPDCNLNNREGLPAAPFRSK